VARLSTRSAHGHYWITITGRLCGRDLRRLERACGHALEHALLPLTLHLAGVDTIDGTAQAFLNRLAHRGALLVFEATSAAGPVTTRRHCPEIRK